MASESNSRSRKRPATPKERLFSNSGDRRRSRFGDAVYGLWPVKPALCLAQEAGCTERHAQYVINGDRKPSWRIIRAVVDEISE